MSGPCIVKLVMDENSDQKESDLELELEPCPWILELNMEIQNMYRKCIQILKLKFLMPGIKETYKCCTNIATDLLTPTIMVFSEDLSTYDKIYIKNMVYKMCSLHHTLIFKYNGIFLKFIDQKTKIMRF